MAARVAGSILATLVLVGMAAFGVWFLKGRPETACGFCQRPIQPRSRTIAEVGSQRKVVCCPRCALSEARQQNKPLRLVEVTDYATGNKLAPDKAYYVDGSRKVLCSHDAPMFDETKHVEQLTFDRCSPGAYAFARREDAQAFANENGGVVLTLAQMLAGVRSK